ncbi:SusE domain-containing protein [Polaribacter tangerinus]|uniref:SusE domain-containing protein n=1 Tax=Polaribacter tangerinus TaxID=1920034 RepID=UPI000B4B16C3|nr:SusE domain-containing protein [Polaribacter tangerinus]
MNTYIKKLSYLFLSLTLLFVACDAEESLTITSPDPAFVLNTPGISNVYLNFALPDNPAFTITWKDEINSNASYSVEMATDNAFTNPVRLGETTKSSFSMTVDEFNKAINDTGVDEFLDIAIYLRVKTESQITNTILLLVTTYPVNAQSFNGIENGDKFVLSLDQNDDVALVLDWEDPILDASISIDVNYTIEAAAPNTDFANPVEVGSVLNTNTLSLTHSKLNSIALQTGIAVDASGDVALRITSSITDAASGTKLERISEVITINVTTYLTVLDLSTTWGIVGSATTNGWNGPDMPMFKTAEDGVLVAYVTLASGEWKFRENNDWSNNLGSGGSTDDVASNGGNFTTDEGAFKITLNLNNNTYSKEEFSLGIVGGAYNNWGASPDFMLEYDQYSDVFRGIVTLIDGEMKFRLNNSWDVDWGDNGADGTLDGGGANIVVTEGIYIATVDMNDLTYTLEPIDNVWGLVGGAYNDWGNTPDAQFKRDWSKPFNDIWILNNVTLTDGEFKFRANNAWDVDYGDNGADGTLERGGANIVTTAGTYSFVLDFSDPANPTYTKK